MIVTSKYPLRRKRWYVCPSTSLVLQEPFLIFVFLLLSILLSNETNWTLYLSFFLFFLIYGLCLAWLLFCTIYITILCLYFTSVPVYCSLGLVLRYSSRDRPENPEYHMTNSVSGPSRPPQKINFRQGNRREWALSRPLLHISWSNAARHYYTHLIADRVAGLYPQSTPVTLQPRRNHGRHRTESSKQQNPLSYIHHEFSRDDSAHGRLGRRRRCREYAGHEWAGADDGEECKFNLSRYWHAMLVYGIQFVCGRWC